jgi:tetratricopeptide (TPR) repeat protein
MAVAWTVQAAHEQLAFLMEAGLIYRDAKRFREAEQVFAGVRALAPKSEVGEVALGSVRFAEGKLDQAIRHYQNALKLNERSAFAHAHLGEAYVFANDPVSARKHLEAAIKIDPRGESGEHARSLAAYLDKTVK